MSKKINRQFACSKMMLPEHRGSLQDHKNKALWQENHRSPLLDEQRQEELQQLLDRAVFKRQALTFTVLDDEGYQNFNGTPLRIDTAAGLIHLDSGGSRPQKIRAADVIDIVEL